MLPRVRDGDKTEAAGRQGAAAPGERLEILASSDSTAKPTPLHSV